MTDPEKVLEHVVRRREGTDSIATVALRALERVTLPMALSLMPWGVTEARNRASGGGPPPATTLLRERYRLEEEVAGYRTTEFGIVRVDEDGGFGIDVETYIFVGKRLFVIGARPHPAHMLRGLPPESETLMADPVVRRMVESPSQTGAIEAVLSRGKWALKGATKARVRLSVGGDGVSIHAEGTSSRALSNVSPLVGVLPDGAVVVTASRGDEAMGQGGPHDPPQWLAERADRFVVAWYGTAHDRVWGRWLAVTPFDRGVAAALKKQGVRVRAGGRVEHGGLTFARPKKLLVVGTDERLVDAAVARATARVPRTDRRGHVFAVDGQALRAQLTELSSRDAIGDWLAWNAAWLGPLMTARLDVSAGGSGRPQVTEARISLRVDGEAADLARVEEALATKERTNRVPLPVDVTTELSKKGLRYKVRVDDAKAVAARLTDGAGRTRVSVVDDTHLLIEVRPGPLESETPVAFPLAGPARARLLESDHTVLWDSSTVMRLARRLASRGTPVAKAKAVLGWIRANVTYEIDPAYRQPAEVLSVRRGDCTEFSQLTAALLRASGVPATLRDGFLALGDGMVAHAWVAFHDGTGWREVEPTSGAISVGSGHIDLRVNEVLTLLELSSFEVVSVEPL